MLVPGSNWAKLENAFANVSWARSSASAGFRVSRSAAPYRVGNNGSASRSKRLFNAALSSLFLATPPPAARLAAGPDNRYALDPRRRATENVKTEGGRRGWTRGGPGLSRFDLDLLCFAGFPPAIP